MTDRRRTRTRGPARSLRRLACAGLLLLGLGRAASGWSGLEAAVALLPQPEGTAALRPIFEYADLAGLRADGDLDDLLAVTLGDAGQALRRPGAIQDSLGVAPESLLRVLHTGPAHRPLLVFWGEENFAATAGQRLVERGFTPEEREGGRLFSRWDDTHLDITTVEPGDPFGFSGQAQRVLGFDDALAGAVRAEDHAALDARHRRGARSVMARAALATTAPMRAGLPPGIEVRQAVALWPEAFLRAESNRRALDSQRPSPARAPGVADGDARLPPFAFALFGAGVLGDTPVLFVAAVYEEQAPAAFAAPVIAEAVRGIATGPGEPASVVHDWVFQGRGLHVAVATVLFGDAPRARASIALRHWMGLVAQEEFVPLDLFH